MMSTGGMGWKGLVLGSGSGGSGPSQNSKNVVRRKEQMGLSAFWSGFLGVWKRWSIDCGIVPRAKAHRM